MPPKLVGKGTQQPTTTTLPIKPTPSQPVPQQQDLALIEPDAHVWAKGIIEAKKRKVKGAPTVVDLARNITQIQCNQTMKGISSIVISVDDVDFTFLDSGFFDTDLDGLLDPVDVNYPDESRWWWRLTQVEPHGDGSMDLTFVDRCAVWLMMLTGPIKADRAKMTRAEFFQMLTKKVKEGKIEFRSVQLDVKQKIDPVQGGGSTTTVTAPVPSNSKASGSAWRLNTSYENDPPGHTSACGTIPGDQRGWSELSTPGTSGQPGGGDFKSLGFRVACGTIANIRNPANGKSTSAPLIDIGYGGGNNRPVIGLYATTLQELGLPLGDAVVDFQLADGRPIQPVSGAPSAAVAGGGGAVGGSATTTIIEPYYFEINPHETYWDGMSREAQEVNWELFFDGNVLYYDSEITLIHQKVAAIIDRNDPALLDWDGIYDARGIATQVNLTMAVDLFTFLPGEVLELKNFGPISTGTTAKMPGRWLIQDIQRSKGDVTTQFTLKQPEKPKNEPAPQVKTVTTSTGGGGGTAQMINGATNPAPGASWSRLDMGFDGNYDMSKGAVAPYNGTVYTNVEGGWPGQGSFFTIVNDNQSGPDYTRAMYFAEGAVPIVPNGAHVTAGQKIGNPVQSGGTGAPGNFEIGPADPQSHDCLAKSYGLGSGRAAALVMAFAHWLQSLGAGAPTNTSSAGAP